MTSKHQCGSVMTLDMRSTVPPPLDELVDTSIDCESSELFGVPLDKKSALVIAGAKTLDEAIELVERDYLSALPKRVGDLRRSNVIKNVTNWSELRKTHRFSKF